MVNAIYQLIKYWDNQGILASKGLDLVEIELFENKKGITLPLEFKNFITKVNGMDRRSSNHVDENGFLFYSLEALMFYEDEFKNEQRHIFHPDLIKKKCLIFADYLYKSWSYGLLMEKDSYSVIIIYEPKRYRVICNSFYEFLDLYLKDAEDLYD